MLRPDQHCGLAQFHRRRKPGILQAVPDPDAVHPLFQDPARFALIVGGQRIQRECEGHFLCLPRPQFPGLPKSGQPAVLLFQLPIGAGYIDLNHLFPCTVPRVSDRDTDRQLPKF